VACLLKARIVKTAETTVARQWLSSDRVVMPTDADATIDELLEGAFSMGSVSRLYLIRTSFHQSLHRVHGDLEAVTERI
jgi:hypothetical protein